VPEPADLELRLRRKDATQYGVDLVFSQPDSETDTRPLGQQVVSVRFDEQELRAAALDAKQYGRKLGQMLFADAHLARAFAQARAAAASQERPLRLRLMIAADAPELHTLRWETLIAPDDPLPLALSERVILTRMLGSADWQPVTLRAKADLRALVAIAAPQDLSEY
jgi:hypothetical protein